MHILETKVLNAIHRSQYKQLALFIRHKYDLNVKTEDGRNGLFFALDISDPKLRRRMIKFCLDHGIDAMQKENINGYTPLHEAIARQQIDSVQLILANISGEIDWRSFDARGRTILHQAVESNNLAIIEALLNVMNHYGVPVDMPDKNGLTPYLLATKLHHREIAQILLKKGHASRRQCDLLTHRSANDWEIAGIEAHSLFVRDKLQHEINNALTDGKITKAKKLKRVYNSQIFTPISEPDRRSSLLSSSSMIGSNTKLSIPIHDMIDRFPGGVIPNSYIASERDEKSFTIEHGSMSPSLLPPISTTRRHRPTLTVNALVDLFQVATEQASPSFRLSNKHNPNTLFDQYARQKDTGTHRSTLAALKTNTNTTSTPKLRRSSNLAASTKRVA